MKTSSIIEGLTILNKYCEEESYKIYAEHDQIFFDTTNRIIEKKDLERLIDLGWHQDEAEYDDEFTVSSYDPDCGWKCYV